MLGLITGTCCFAQLLFVYHMWVLGVQTQVLALLGTIFPTEPSSHPRIGFLVFFFSDAKGRFRKTKCHLSYIVIQASQAQTQTLQCPVVGRDFLLQGSLGEGISQTLPSMADWILYLFPCGCGLPTALAYSTCGAAPPTEPRAATGWPQKAL